MNLQHLIRLNRSEFLTALFIFLFIVITVSGSRLLRLNSGNSIFFEEETTIEFNSLKGLDSLQFTLNEKGIDFDESELEWAASLLGWKRFQRGLYKFEDGYSYEDFLSKIAKGIQDPVSVVILPGITIERLAEITSEQLHFEKEDLYEVFNDSTYLLEKGLSQEQLFGRMLPNTYSMYWTTEPRDFTDKLLGEFDNAITEEHRSRAQQVGYSMDEILTLASIVEWEAKFEDEKARISGLYLNRLERGMRLQADPTVNFALGERRRLLFEDYQFDHPFNTYLISGLPPAPITNPSLNTIEATLYPEDHNYLYMVANPEGGHVFTKTFHEHQIESEKWRIWLREQYRIKRQREAEESQTSENEAQ
ncbi:MAG TPA: endolytic transglycosylase MltG [Gracilimonas sp.]|uniref:endolytic transglycosylase MltG n=1 Tax=Gracilimonas sp. TaxID=1974203 RepID=UPI002D8409F6|nr:endolytic transglycosylase MltG [Gracilimonas sp.]